MKPVRFDVLVDGMGVVFYVLRFTFYDLCRMSYVLEFKYKRGQYKRGQTYLAMCKHLIGNIFSGLSE